MLGKIFKYDIKWLFKKLAPFYGISIVLALIIRGIKELAINFSIFNTLYILMSAVFIIGLIALVFYTFFLIISRYYKNMFRDESYLTHTLPVKKSSLFISKVLSSIIFMVLGIIIALISLLIVYYTKENFEIIKNGAEYFANLYHFSVVKLITLIIIMGLLGILIMMMLIFTGITIGQSHSNEKGMYSIIACIVIYFVTQFINGVTILLVALFKTNLLESLNDDIPPIEALNTVMLTSICLSVAYIFIYYFVNKHFLEKRLNIE